jgi:hypothetical protein
MSSGMPALQVTSIDASTVDAPVVPPACGIAISSSPPICGASACGNGTIDTCDVSRPCLPVCDFDGVCTDPSSDEMCPLGVTEGCDGANLGGVISCAAEGFRGGLLACNASCTVDTRGCQTCVRSSLVPACNELVDCSAVQSLALGVADPLIAVASVTTAADPDANDVVPGSVEIALFAGDLSPLAHKAIPSITDAVNIALARSPSGWLVAVERSGPQVELIPLDAGGNVRGTSYVIASASAPVLAPRGDESSVSGGPLLVWSGTHGVRLAALLDDEGRFGSPPVEATESAIDPELSGATFTGDGFLYGDRTSQGVTIAKMGLDGTIAALTQPANQQTELPELAWLGDHAALTYDDFSGASVGVTFMTLDANGRPLSPPSALGWRPLDVIRAPIVSLDNGTSAVLLGGYGPINYTTGLAAARLSPQGTPTLGPFLVATDPQKVVAWRAVRRGPELIAGWIGQGGSGSHPSGYLHLARVTP